MHANQLIEEQLLASTPEGLVSSSLSDEQLLLASPDDDTSNKTPIYDTDENKIIHNDAEILRSSRRRKLSTA